MKSFRITLLTTLSLLAFSVSAHAVRTFKDTFTADTLNTKRWSLGADRAQLTQSNGRLNFTTNSRRLTDAYVILKGSARQPSYNENWEATLTVVNKSSNKYTWIGLAVLNAADMSDTAGVELYREGSKKLVLNDFQTNGNGAPDLIKSVSSSKLFLRVRFNKNDKVLTTSYRTSRSAPWTTLSTFSTKGSTGTTRRGNWKMTNTSKFKLAIYGGSEERTVGSGLMFADNFIVRNY